MVAFAGTRFHFVGIIRFELRPTCSGVGGALFKGVPGKETLGQDGMGDLIHGFGIDVLLVLELILAHAYPSARTARIEFDFGDNAVKFHTGWRGTLRKVIVVGDEKRVGVGGIGFPPHQFRGIGCLQEFRVDGNGFFLCLLSRFPFVGARFLCGRRGRQCRWICLPQSSTPGLVNGPKGNNEFVETMSKDERRNGIFLLLSYFVRLLSTIRRCGRKGRIAGTARVRTRRCARRGLVTIRCVVLVGRCFGFFIGTQFFVGLGVILDHPSRHDAFAIHLGCTDVIDVSHQQLPFDGQCPNSLELVEKMRHEHPQVRPAVRRGLF
mmetsp:Transcript_2369/g.6323  ORF Transcript_2369/g.6323 Transcript_2369/m.6323 type:complete len:322 (-) Transcript_2369:385-1350(-)